MGTWTCERAREEDGVLHLHASRLWPPSEAEQAITLAPTTRYRIALDARGPDGGAAHFLRAEIREDLGGEALGFDANPYVLMAYPEQLGEDWRHFEWGFTTPDTVPDDAHVPRVLDERAAARGPRHHGATCRGRRAGRRAGSASAGRLRLRPGGRPRSDPGERPARADLREPALGTAGGAAPRRGLGCRRGGPEVGPCALAGGWDAAPPRPRLLAARGADAGSSSS